MMFTVQSAIHLLCVCISILFTTSRVSCWPSKTVFLPEKVFTKSLNLDITEYIQTPKSNLHGELLKKLTHVSFLEMAKKSDKVVEEKLKRKPRTKKTKQKVKKEESNVTKRPRRKEALLCVNNDKAFIQKLKIAEKSSIVNLVFANESCGKFKEVFNYAKENLRPWREFFRLLLVNNAKCLNASAQYQIQTVPTFVIQKFTKIHLKIVGEDYDLGMREYVDPLDLLRADNDTDFKRILTYLQKNGTTSIIFGKNSDESLYDFIEDNNSAWRKKFKSVFVDLKKCKQTVKDYKIKSTPAFVFIKDDNEVKRIFGKDYRSETLHYAFINKF